jgi:hypothetical protein
MASVGNFVPGPAPLPNSTRTHALPLDGSRKDEIKGEKSPNVAEAQTVTKQTLELCARVGTRTPFYKPLSASSSLSPLFPRVISFLPSPPGVPTPTALTFVPCARGQGRFFRPRRVLLLLPVPVPPCPRKAAACHFSLLLPRVRSSPFLHLLLPLFVTYISAYVYSSG